MKRDCPAERLAKNLVSLKREFAREYGGASRTPEVIPASESDLFPVEPQDLELLHMFVRENPIYCNSYEQTVCGVRCVVYEGDVNKYWLGSILHGSSRAPFSPTWMMSAYVGALHARELGYGQIVDIGSGDGRIAFCGRVASMRSYSIEVDEALVGIQEGLAGILDFYPSCSDAASFDYSALDLDSPAFFIGGLAQMGGCDLAAAVMARAGRHDKAGWVFAGTHSPKYRPDPKNQAGWGPFIEENNLEHVRTVCLPTAWTFGEPDATPYVFARATRDSNPN